MKKIVSVCVNDKMQKNYIYELAEPVGKNFSPSFKPELTPTNANSRDFWREVYAGLSG